ncbi:DUF982 domain-containing protein [Mesorhizobium sp. M0166]|uniref:DUF982 domain-containing protein n=1 Tax=Mesorhizobium sp. M0166 TaxID=2956902 RepID=UPI0033355504
MLFARRPERNRCSPVRSWHCAGTTMHDPFFAVPITVETETVGEFRTLSSVSEAATFMMERWPEPHGPRYIAALQACTGPLTTA